MQINKKKLVKSFSGLLAVIGSVVVIGSVGLVFVLVSVLVSVVASVTVSAVVVSIGGQSGLPSKFHLASQ